MTPRPSWSSPSCRRPRGPPSPAPGPKALAVHEKDEIASENEEKMTAVRAALSPEAEVVHHPAKTRKCRRAGRGNCQISISFQFLAPVRKPAETRAEAAPTPGQGLRPAPFFAGNGPGGRRKDSLIAKCGLKSSTRINEDIAAQLGEAGRAGTIIARARAGRRLSPASNAILHGKRASTDLPYRSDLASALAASISTSNRDRNAREQGSSHSGSQRSRGRKVRGPAGLRPHLEILSSSASKSRRSTWVLKRSAPGGLHNVSANEPHFHNPPRKILLTRFTGVRRRDFDKVGIFSLNRSPMSLTPRIAVSPSHWLRTPRPVPVYRDLRIATTESGSNSPPSGRRRRREPEQPPVAVRSLKGTDGRSRCPQNGLSPRARSGCARLPFA